MFTATFNLVARIIYRNFWIMKGESLLIHSLAWDYISFKMAPTICQQMVNVVNDFVKKLQILCSSDHPILFKFHQRMVKICIKDLQIVF